MKSGILSLGAGIIGALIGAGAMVYWQGNVAEKVKDTILSQPEILPEAMKNLERKEAAKSLASHGNGITQPFGKAWEGAANGDVTLVEFFDYNCGYCKRAVADVDKLLANDKRLKIVYREMPVLGDASVKAAAISLAVAQSGNFSAFHRALYGNGASDEATVDAAIKAAGLDPAAIRAKAESPAIQAELQKAVDTIGKLGFQGTPTWVVGDKIINGAVGYDELAAAIAEVRAAKAG